MAGTVSLPCSSEAGAQSHLTDALSVRLARYEAADAAAPPPAGAALHTWWLT